jgi:CDP-diacylglycerol---serine O-phosphatidyltransferase
VKLFSIPNIITLLNLACGCLAIVFAFNGNLVWAAYLVGIAAVLDFLDGFVARALKQYSPIGKDLDSLADMVTFGVVPGVVMYQMMKLAMTANVLLSKIWRFPHANQFDQDSTTLMTVLPFAAFFITLFSALRLAKFNNDTRQSDSFIGVPTPANSILICSLALIGNDFFAGLANVEGSFWDMGEYVSVQGNVEGAFPWWITNLTWILLGITGIMSYLLISEIPLFALKFKSFKWKGNELRFSFLAVAVIMLVLLQYIALPLIIVLYILLSVINNLVKRKDTQNASR